jgi:hypothetical protein
MNNMGLLNYREFGISLKKPHPHPSPKEKGFENKKTFV